MLWVRIPFRRGVLDTTLCDKVCPWLATGRWFSPGTPVSSTNKTDRHDITEILLKAALNSITLTLIPFLFFCIEKNGIPISMHRSSSKWQTFSYKDVLSTLGRHVMKCLIFTWRLFQKRAVHTNFHIYVFIKRTCPETSRAHSIWYLRFIRQKP